MLRLWKGPKRALCNLSTACAWRTSAPARLCNSTWSLDEEQNLQQWTQRHRHQLRVRSYATSAENIIPSDERNEASISSSPTIPTQNPRRLPLSCPGCGAPTQAVDGSIAGFYSLTSSRVLNYFGQESKQQRVKDSRKREDEVFRRAMEANADSFSQPVQPRQQVAAVERSPAVPVCDRCHGLKTQSRGESIIHPGMTSIQAIIGESPHNRNHIYHVIDAADFPMSLIPNLGSALQLPKQRSQNRRSKHTRFSQGRTAEVSFIITRSDLLAPQKEQVDRMVPYLQGVLRDALGRSGQNVRLGNVRCVSAKRGWWTKKVKEEIWNRGGAGWMVGKVNVGKSALYEAVFPKGRSDFQDANLTRIRERAARRAAKEEMETIDSNEQPLGSTDNQVHDEEEDQLLDETTLLPPARPETNYPDMPIVNSLPGTTASPIRIPFGNGKGELVDLPGLLRSSLDEFVDRPHHSKMIMKHRVAPTSHTLRPGQSLLLGGLIRITPKFDDDQELIIMAYPFLSEAFTPHVTGTHKAIAIQTGIHSAASRDREGNVYEGSVENIATPAAKTQIASAGCFPLRWDVTKRHTGALTDPVAGKQKTATLPFAVYGIDILLEGVGWVELTCQVRKSRLALAAADESEASDRTEASWDSVPSGVPQVEVYSPLGKFIGTRRPMCAWVLSGAQRTPVHEQRPRPRQSIGRTKRQTSSLTKQQLIKQK